MKTHIFLVDRLFNGETFLNDVGILVNDNTIVSVFSQKEMPKDIDMTTIEGSLLAPAFKDLQINGAGGLMFSAAPSVEALKEIHKYSLKGGATEFMATVPTNSHKIIKQAINATSSYWSEGLPGLLGLHLEGPYLNPIKKGAHIEKFIKTPTLQEAKELVKLGEGHIKMITLAPECCPDDVITYFIDQGITVSAGHSNATYKEAMHGFSLGIKMCTHLYNAMSPFTHKEVGLVGAAFDSAVYAGIIIDGVHVNPPAVKMAHKLKGNRLCYVTDAVTAINSDSYHYEFAGDRYVTDKGTLAGSCLKMNQAVQNAVKMGVEPIVALQSASLRPSEVMGSDQKHGRIAPGYLVDWVVLNDDFEVVKTIM